MSHDTLAGIRRDRAVAKARSWFAASFRRKVATIFLFISIPFVLLVPLLLYVSSSRIIVRQAYEAGMLNLAVIAGNLDLVFDAVERQSVLVVTGETVQRLVSDHAPLEPHEAYRQNAPVQEFLTRAARAAGIVDAYSLTMLDGTELWSSGATAATIRTDALGLIENSASYQPVRSEWRGVDLSPYMTDGDRVAVVTYRRSFNDASTGRPAGVIEAFVRVDAIASLFVAARIGETGIIYLVDGRGRGITVPDRLPDGAIIDETEARTPFGWGHRLVLSLPYERFGWELKGIVPVRELVQSGRTLAIVLVFVLLGSVVVTSVLIVRAATRVTQPLTEITNAARAVGEGDFTTRLAITNRDEFGVLAHSFNRMVDRISSLIDSITQEERKKRRYELELMTSQLNPHFLHNSLDAICGLAELGRTEELVAMVQDLAGFYETILNGGGVLISVTEELELTGRFVEILNVRYPRRFRYHVHVDDRVTGVLLPKLTIQPLVENAIYHGLKPKPQGGVVDVSATSAGKNVQICVKDDGVGFRRRGPGTGGSGSFGLRAVEERLKLYCGDRSSMVIRSVPEHGTELLLTLPKSGGRLAL